MTKIRFDKLIILLSTAVAEENILDKEILHHMQMFLMLIDWLRNTTELQETRQIGNICITNLSGLAHSLSIHGPLHVYIQQVLS